MLEWSSDTETALTHRLLELLQALPGVQARLNRIEPNRAHSAQVDAEIELDVAGKPIILLIEAKKTAYPRDVRQALWQVKAHSQARPSGSEYLLAAQSLSPGAKELLRAERIGYYDSGGSLFLPVPGAYIYIDKPPPKARERSVRSLFSGRRAQVLHALLTHDQEWFGVTAVAKQAQVAPSTVSEVVGQLERLDWLESRGQGPVKERRLREPGRLLDAWVKQLTTLRPPIMRRYYVPGLKPDVLMDRLNEVFKKHHVDYALSYEAAAQRYTPFLSGISQVRTRLLPGIDANAAISELDARAVDEGANLVVVETGSAGELLFRQQVGGIWLASPVQVYLDLLRGEGRAREMAEHLRRERIGF